MAVHVEKKGDEVYVWMNGSLLYKRWVRTGQSALFTLKPSWMVRNTDTTVSFTEQVCECCETKRVFKDDLCTTCHGDVNA